MNNILKYILLINMLLLVTSCVPNNSSYRDCYNICIRNEGDKINTQCSQELFMEGWDNVGCNMTKEYRILIRDYCMNSCNINNNSMRSDAR